MVPFPLDSVFIYAIYYDSRFMSFFVISATYISFQFFFFVLKISLMQSNSVVISFYCCRFFFMMKCGSKVDVCGLCVCVLFDIMSLERDREQRVKKIEHHRMAYACLAFDRLCVGRLLCRVCIMKNYYYS